MLINPMARRPTIVFAFLLAFFFISTAFSSNQSSFIKNISTTKTMFLPLFFNNHKINNINYNYTRGGRHLHTLPIARMFLHDDLLLNGYYTTRLWIGSPPQRFALIVDTGSTVTYVPCSNCEQCGKHQDPRFQFHLSSTFVPVKCNVDCVCDDEREFCTYERQYAEMSSSSGVLGEDVVSFGTQSGLEPQRAVFGCENIETGDLYSQHADGIMGLGRGDLSIVDQLVDKGVINDSFAICYGGMDVGGGGMVLGEISPPADMVFARSDPNRSPYYNLDLKELHVAGKVLSVDPKVFDGKHGTVLDSGTTYAYLPEAAFGPFKEAVFKELRSLKRIPGPDPNYNDVCFSGGGSDSSKLSETFPSVEMVFGNGQKLLLSPENYLFRHSKVRGSYCLGIFQNGKDPTTLLGGIVVRNTLVKYDRQHEKIGFWKTNCSELWEKLNMSIAPPPVTGSGEVNSTVDMAPAPGPGEPLLNEDPGQVKIGVITFYMSLSMTYKELKPHISQLAELMARDLRVNASQVRLKLSSKQNESLIKWSIFPEESADYMSSTTAMYILSKLEKNSLNLPDSFFGSYKVFDWKIEQPPKRTWRQQHYLVAVIVLVVLIVCIVVAGGLWHVWRRNRSLVSYKPVDAIVAEQELQPLQN